MRRPPLAAGGRGPAFALIGSGSWGAGPRAEGWSGLGLGASVGGFWRAYLHVGLRVAATWEARGPRGTSGSGALLRALGCGQAVRFPYREPGPSRAVSWPQPHSHRAGPGPALPTSRPRAPAGWHRGSPSPRTGPASFPNPDFKHRITVQASPGLDRRRNVFEVGAGDSPTFPRFRAIQRKKPRLSPSLPTSHLSVKPYSWPWIRPRSPFPISLNWSLRVPQAAFIFLTFKTSNNGMVLVLFNFMSPRFSKCPADIDLIPHNNFVRELSLLSFINKKSEKSNLPNITQLITEFKPGWISAVSVPTTKQQMPAEGLDEMCPTPPPTPAPRPTYQAPIPLSSLWPKAHPGMDWSPACCHLACYPWSLIFLMGGHRARALTSAQTPLVSSPQWSLQNQAKHGAASPPGVKRTQAMENVEHAGPGVPVPPSLGKPRMGGECPSAPNSSIICLPTVLRLKAQLPSPPVTRRRSRMDEATWYLDSDDSSPLGSPSTPPTLNGEWPVAPQKTFCCTLPVGTGETTRSQQAQQSQP